MTTRNGLERISASLVLDWIVVGLRLGDLGKVLEATVGPSHGQASVLRNDRDNQQECPRRKPSEGGRTRLPKYAARAIWQNKPTSTTPVNILIDFKIYGEAEAC